MIDSVEYNAPIQFHVEQQSTKNAKAIVVPKLIIVLLINLSSVSIHSHPIPPIYIALLHASVLVFLL